jgi:hypothetical protein
MAASTKMVQISEPLAGRVGTAVRIEILADRLEHLVAQPRLRVDMLQRLQDGDEKTRRSPRNSNI